MRPSPLERLAAAGFTATICIAILAGTPAMAQGPACATPAQSCPDVAALMALREGYGRNARGGLDGEFITITSSADAGPGSLRQALTGSRKPRWIRFASDMDIVLTSQIRVPSNVTIDGRGKKVRLLEYGFGVYNSNDVIITHVTIDGQFKNFSQAVDIANFSRNVWLNHLDLSRFNNRLVNVKTGSTDVTMSWIKFHNHNKVMLLNNVTTKNQFANWDRDSIARVTLHHSWFVDTVQRNPRAQIGVFHLYNNLIENWDFYGMSFSLQARATVEGNMFANNATRACSEPDIFKTVEGLDRNFCHNIPKAGVAAVLPNGSSDRESYEARKAQFGYTQDYRAFLKVRDNVGFGNAQVNIEDYRPGEVPVPPYCYAYEKPSPALAERIRKGAGAAGQPAGASQTCPSPAILAAAHSAPVASGWKLLGRNLSRIEGSMEAPQFSLMEVDGATGRHGISRTAQFPKDRWAIEIGFKPAGARNLAIVITDPAAPRSRIAAICTPRGVTFVGARPPAIEASSSAEKDGFFRCYVEGMQGAEGSVVRIDMMTADGDNLQPAGKAGAGLVLRNARVMPLAQ